MRDQVAPLAAKPDTVEFRGLGLPARLCLLLGLDFDAMTVRGPGGGYHHAPLEDAIWGMAKDLVRARAEALDLVQGRPPGSSRWAAEFQKECRGAPPLGAAEALALGSARLRSDGPAHWSEALYILRDELRSLGEDYPDTSALWTGPLRAAAMLRRDREALTRIRKTLGCQPGREAAAVEFHEGWWSARVERVLEWAREDPTARGEVFSIIANGTPSPTAKSPALGPERLRDGGWSGRAAELLINNSRPERVVDEVRSAMQVLEDVRKALLTPDGAHIVEHAAGVLQMLRSLQWSATVDLVHGGYGHGCPVCEALEADGHVGDCALASILCEGGR